MNDADRAYAAAERRIAEAKAEGATRLDLDREETRALQTLPPGIAELTGLETLDLDNTQITDLRPLSGLTGLEELWLDGAVAVDLRPLRPLNRLAAAPGGYGLTFRGSGAARADARIAEIAENVDHAERAWALFAYQEDWQPPAGGAVPGPDEVDEPENRDDKPRRVAPEELPRQAATGVRYGLDDRGRMAELAAPVPAEDTGNSATCIPNCARNSPG